MHWHVHKSPLRILGLLLMVAVCPTWHSPVEPTTSAPRIDLQSFSLDASNVKAIFKSGSLLFNLTSSVQSRNSSELHVKAECEMAPCIVSTVSITEAAGKPRWKQPTILSQLVIQQKFMLERQIPGLESKVLHAARDMVRAVQSSKVAFTQDLELADLALLYDAMVSQLAQKLDLQTRFSQVPASLFYHSSIVWTAHRLESGVPEQQACPPHQAYETQGLFACQQEYVQHAQRALSSALLSCKDQHCVQKLQGLLGSLIKSSTAGRDLAEATKLTEDLLGLGNNSHLAEEIARLIACGNISCEEPGCNHWMYTDGWFIYGADWGCCGDYAGCCYFAAETCLIHDAICTCCSFPAFCLDPFCQPDAWCTNTTAAPPL